MTDPLNINTETGTPYSRKALSDAFDRVANPSDWRDRIDAFVDADQRDVTERAIIFYTATVPTFYQMRGGRLRVTSIGYRAGPAGDH